MSSLPKRRRHARAVPVLLVAAFCALQTRACLAAFTRSSIDPYSLCQLAIGAAERTHTVPPRLLWAIGRVESGRRNPLTGALTPWPWAINVEGEPHFYDSAAEAIAAVRQFRAAGRVSIDVGCMQINLVQHPDAFASLEAAFDPVSNATYAADLLTRLHDGHDWMQAAGLYHSATPAIGEPYRARVAALMQQDGGAMLADAATGGGLSMSSAMPLPPSGAPGASLRGFVTRLAPHSAPPSGIAPGAGRGLDAYRSAPVRLAAWTHPTR